MPIVVLKKEIESALANQFSFVQLHSQLTTTSIGLYHPNGIILKCILSKSDDDWHDWLFRIILPKQFKNWLFSLDSRFPSDLCMSYTMNKLMSKWFRRPREELVSLLYRPILEDEIWFFAPTKEGFSAPIAETLTMLWKTVPTANCRVGHCYPNLKSIKCQCVSENGYALVWQDEFILSDLLIVEVSPDFCLQEFEFDLYFYKSDTQRIISKSEFHSTIRMFGSDAIELISTSQSRIYALPLGLDDSLIFNDADDVSSYVRRIFEWSEDFSYDRARIEEHPATLFTASTKFCYPDELLRLVNRNLIKLSMWSLELK